jgi:phosphate transport system substrate-binding protein
MAILECSSLPMDNMLRNMPILKSVLFISTLFLGVNGTFAGTIVYRGSSTVGQFMQDAAKVYKLSTFDINTQSESSGGEDSIAAGKADIGGVAREVRQEILAKGVHKFLIGKDAIGILVHPSNPVTALSIEQLAGIFAGEMTNWIEVGGQNMPIDVYVVNPRSATRHVVQKRVLREKSYGGKRIRTIRPDSRIIDMVSENPGGLGQLSFSFLNGANVKIIRPNGQMPTVNNPNYPITRNLHIVTKGEPEGDIKRFIDWTLSPEGQKIVKKRFIGVK